MITNVIIIRDHNKYSNHYYSYIYLFIDRKKDLLFSYFYSSGKLVIKLQLLNFQNHNKIYYLGFTKKMGNIKDN